MTGDDVVNDAVYDAVNVFIIAAPQSRGVDLTTKKRGYGTTRCCTEL
jgi:hypothetical protein